MAQLIVTHISKPMDRGMSNFMEPSCAVKSHIFVDPGPRDERESSAADTQDERQTLLSSGVYSSHVLPSYPASTEFEHQGVTNMSVR